MAWNLQNDRPIYLQLMEVIKIRIISGIYPAGSKLPSVRELATEASVNPNTMQKALAELEREELVFANRTSGRFITEDSTMIQQMKQDIAQEQLQNFLKQMEQLGFQKKETLEFLIQTCNETIQEES